jgi:hypothetical protein
MEGEEQEETAGAMEGGEWTVEDVSRFKSFNVPMAVVMGTLMAAGQFSDILTRREGEEEGERGRGEGEEGRGSRQNKEGEDSGKRQRRKAVKQGSRKEQVEKMGEKK